MKHLILVRHAKSSWKDSGVEDHDRTLARRGERDAPFMAKIFRDKKMNVDLMISSTAIRALSTAQEFAQRLDYKKEKIQKASELYLAELEELVDFVRNLDDENKTVMMFGHNPGFTWLANALTNDSIENIPTCGIVAIDFRVSSWKEISSGSGTIRFFEYPKMYFKEAED